jgi:hypothetical protein
VRRGGDPPGAGGERQRRPGDVAEHERLLRGMYRAFHAREIDRVLPAMTTDVDWPNAWDEWSTCTRSAKG